VLSQAVLSHIISCRNLTQRQRTLLEEFAKEEQGEDEKEAKKEAGASG
jgi:molecular chaperone DnaJ